MKDRNSCRFCKLRIDLAKRQDLTSTDKVILAIIEDRIGQNGACWPGIRKLARDAGVHESTVLASIQRLQKSGDLLVKKRGSGRSNLYSLGPKSGGKTQALGKSKRSENAGSGVRKTQAQALVKPEHNQTDQLNKTKGETSLGVPHVQLVAQWNQLANTTDLPKVMAISDGRKRKLKARWQEKAFRDGFQDILKGVEASKFLRGQNDREWKVDFDWIIQNHGNYVKILEGKYAAGSGNRQATLPSVFRIRNPTEEELHIAEGLSV